MEVVTLMCQAAKHAGVWGWIRVVLSGAVHQTIPASTA